MDEDDMQGMDEDQDYGMEGENMMDMDMDMGDEEYGQQLDDDEESINFDADPAYAHLPPLDKRRKVRREVIRTVNELRSKMQAN